MPSAFSYFNEATASEEPTVRQRCMRAIAVVANIWTVLGAFFQLLALNAVAGSPAHLKLQVCGISSLCIAAAIYSVYFPLYFILREPRG